MRTIKPLYFTNSGGERIDVVGPMIKFGAKITLGEIEIVCSKTGNELLETKVSEFLFIKDTKENRDLLGNDYSAEIKEVVDEGDNYRVIAELSIN